jgi:hypothetical protein
VPPAAGRGASTKSAWGHKQSLALKTSRGQMPVGHGEQDDNNKLQLDSHDGASVMATRAAVRFIYSRKPYGTRIAYR